MDLPTRAMTSPNPADLAPYKIQVADRLAIRFYRNPELDQEVVVRPDGKISLPFIDDVLCAGIAPQDLDRLLTTKYAGELSIPDITVIVLAFGAQKIYITGQIFKPGMIHLDGEKTVYQAIKQAGGFDIGARRTHVVLIRRMPDGEYAGHRINLKEVEYGRNPGADVPLQAGDMIHVPNSVISNMGEFTTMYIRNLLPVNPTTVIRGF
jgi:protein involved in polysaccharide export with SLBB domain